jgi:glycosyltransferase involved in cell wall biosynthesis
VTRCCLVVTTSERPDALARVLASVERQSRPPDEVAIADDGSGEETRRIVERFAASAALPVHHAWQPRDGFRAARARNLAIARTACEYLVLIDGDMVLHPQFLADHLQAAAPGTWRQGTRIELDATATRRLLSSAELPRAWSPGLGIRRRSYAWRSAILSSLCSRAGNAFVATKGCNQGFWRRDLAAVNGFDEEFTGWGAEDKELCARLESAGVVRRTLAFGAIAFHLAHPPAARDRAAENRRRWLDSRRSGRTRCRTGLDGHASR